MPTEWFDLVDEHGTVVGKATRQQCHNGSKRLHPVVHVHIFNAEGKLLLQKRKLNKDIQPGKWDTSVGGHIQSGESVEDAIRREVLEEAGVKIDLAQLRTVDRYVFESEVERELVYSYAYNYDGSIRFQEEEIDAVQFLDAAALAALIEAGETTPNFNQEFIRLQRQHLLKSNYTIHRYESIMNRLAGWAKHDEHLQAVMLIGSRARSQEPADEWSDLDLLVITDEPATYIRNTSWINEIGTPLLFFTEPSFDHAQECRILFADFLDVDVIFIAPAEFRQSFMSGAVRDIMSRGYAVLLDKEAWQTYIQTEYKTVPPQELSDATIVNEIQDYWYHCVWIAKKIRRGELWTAVNGLNCYLKTKLLRMIEIETQLSHSEPIDTWHTGRLIEKWADPAILQRLPGCFSDYNEQALKVALQHQMSVYHDIASAVTTRRGLPYPDEAHAQILSWLAAMLSQKEINCRGSL